MSWPQPTDYNEAIQNPRTAFRDPELRSAHPVLNALGLPLPRSGSFADVYEVRCPTTQRAWAVKCFTREVPGLEQRYAAISLHLQRVRLPFTVDFQFLHDGICIKGVWFPVVKMRWIEGLTLNEFVRTHLDRPALLTSLAQLWVRMARELRDAELAHGDLQHGNVLLVAGSQATTLALRLIDYDGMYVPALMNNRSSEVGHPNFQHPERIREGRYGFEMDRFSHLVVCTAIRALGAGGKSLWDRFDTGDNLLFKESDFRSTPSPLFQALWEMGEPQVRDLAGHLLLATRRPCERAPLLTDLLGDSGVRPLEAAEKIEIQRLLAPPTAPALEPSVTVTSADPKQPWWEGASPPAAGAGVLPKAPPSLPAKTKPDASPEHALKERLEKKRKQKQANPGRSNAKLYLGLGVIALLCVGVLGIVRLTRWLSEHELPNFRSNSDGSSPTAGFSPDPGDGVQPDANAATLQGPSGLIAELFPAVDLTGRATVRLHPRIDFGWDHGRPDPEVSVDDFSIRWSGFIRIPEAGRFRFTTRSEDGVRVRIDGRQVIDDWNTRTSPGAVSSSGEIDLVAGNHPLLVTYFAKAGNAEVRLYWEGPGVVTGIVPDAHFSHDAEKMARLAQATPPPAIADGPPGVSGGPSGSVPPSSPGNDSGAGSSRSRKRLPGTPTPDATKEIVADTRRLGGNGGTDFRNLPSPPAYLSGFKITTRSDGANRIIRSIRPVYTLPNGLTLVDPAVYGQPAGPEETVGVRAGFVVGGIKVRWGTRVDGIGVILVPVRDGKLLTARQEELPWVGGMGGRGPELLGGDGTPIVGIFGRYGLDLDAIGLIQLKEGSR